MSDEQIKSFSALWESWNDRHNWQDIVSLSFLVLVGITGLFFVMLPPKKEEKPQERTMFTKYSDVKDNLAFPHLNPRRQVASPERLMPDFKEAEVSVEGGMELGKPIRMVIDNYDSRFRYVMDMGNGEVHPFLGKVKTYTFRQSGSYTLTLFAERGDKARKRVFSRKIYIKSKGHKEMGI